MKRFGWFRQHPLQQDQDKIPEAHQQKSLAAFIAKMSLAFVSSQWDRQGSWASPGVRMSYSSHSPGQGKTKELVQLWDRVCCSLAGLLWENKSRSAFCPLGAQHFLTGSWQYGVKRERISRASGEQIFQQEAAESNAFKGLEVIVEEVQIIYYCTMEQPHVKSPKEISMEIVLQP